MSGNRNRWYWKLGRGVIVAIGGGINSANCAFAQITPDSTLPNNSRTRTQENTRIIEGGTQAGSNLFHSFDSFSVPTGSTAQFNNALDIQNIISRVTGKSISNIDGLIKANASANLFLINPNGIIFGPNASLNIGGSFLASTANAISFGNQGFFSASNPETSSSLLTVNPSALLFNQIKTASIQNNSIASSGLNPSSAFTATGLRVPDGRRLLLVGGDINMDGGGLFAFGGRVELGGLAGAGTVGLNGDGNNLSLSFPDSVERSNVFLSNGAAVTVIAGDRGSIAVNARNLEMTGESKLFAGIETGLSSDNSQAGNIEVNATGAINLNKSFIANQVLPEANGQGGDVNISASTLQVEGGAQVSAASFGKGNGGNLTVTASQAINLIGRRSRLFAQTEGAGAAGNLQISTKQLTVQDGAQISASSFAQGQAGSLFVNASESIELIGKSPDSSQIASGLFAQAQGAGAAGNLAIATGRLIVRDGARVSTSTFGQGQGGSLSVNASDSVELIGGGGLSAQAQGDGVAGNLTIATGKLIVRDGSQVLTTTYGQGQGGILSVNASDSVELIGRLSSLFADTQGDGAAGNLTITTGKLIVQNEAQVGTGTAGKGQGGNLTVNALESVEISSSADSSRFSGLFAQTQGAGAAGDLTITTEQLTVKDRSQVAVASEGTGKAGNLDVTARSILLDGNQAGINAQTASGNGGNITLQDLDLLLLRHGSQISATAGTARHPGDGGNITINAPSGFIVAVPGENSDITANAYTGKGGRVDINASGIYGIQPRQNPTSLSDITASSEFGRNGTLELNTLDIDPNSGLVNLPTVPVDTEVAQACTPGGSQARSEFIITGRGGLPQNPGEALNTDAVQVDLITLTPQVNQPSTTAVSTSPTSPTPSPIVEATGWVIDKNGDVILTANAPTVTPHSSWQRTADCRAFNQQLGG